MIDSGFFNELWQLDAVQALPGGFVGDHMRSTTASKEGEMQKVLKLPGVMEMTGLGRSSIYQRMKDKRFPRAIELGSRSRGWLQAEIEAWIVKQVKERDSQQA